MGRAQSLALRPLAKLLPFLGRIAKARPVVQELQVAYSFNTLSFWARPSPGTFFNMRLGPRRSYSS